jgi:hypothetical protein
MYACIFDIRCGFFEGVCGRRISNSFSVTHPSLRREPRLDWSRTVGRKTWYGLSNAACLQNLPDNADKLTNEGGEAPQGRTEAEGASETLSGCQECQPSAGGTSHANQVALLS